MTHSEHQPLLNDHSVQWQSIENYFESLDFSDIDQKKIRRLAIASRYALELIHRKPNLINGLLKLEKFQLDPNFLAAVDKARLDNDRIKQELRIYRHQKLLEIIYLDVVQNVALREILRHLSDLADLLLEQAIDACNVALAKKHGQPSDELGEAMNLNVIAMGKLGGRELNFSSDIDLIFCYSSDGELKGYGHLSHQEYFARLARSVTQALSDNTADGFVYRVDLRLRPWGQSGPVVLSHAALEHYYQLHGREWEQYAMVKARVLHATNTDHDYLMMVINSFVYRKYHDHRVFEGLAELKAKIDQQAQANAMRTNIKIGNGGIREIEFFVQAFQILKGGRNHQLQRTEIFAAFSALEEHSIVDADTIKHLREAYCFLRLLENRIQMFDDRQTHELPSDLSQQVRISITLGYDNWDDLNQELEQHRQRVDQCFSELFKRPDSELPKLAIDDAFVEEMDIDHQWEIIEQAGFSDTAEINQQLNIFLQSKAWRYMSARAKMRFKTLLPDLLTAIKVSQQPATLFTRFLRFFSAIAGRSVYFELLYQNPPLLAKISSLFDQSPWIADEVTQYPILLENLIQTAGPEGFDQSALLEQLLTQLHNVEGDVEMELDVLRLFKREQTLVIATAELAEEINATDAGRYLSDLAEVLLEAVYRLASHLLQKQYGKPQCVENDRLREAHFAIIGYGKLGGHEIHYQSDLDVIFLHDSCGSQQITNGNKSIENSVYFSRLAQKIISITGVLTGSGKLYEIDSRLRPDGNSGLLVSSIKAYQRYQLEKAWTWEHQALVRARQVAGDVEIEAPFNQIRTQALALKREPEKLRADILEMRERVYLNKHPGEQTKVNLKHCRGGLLEIEFLVQYWVLTHANSVGSASLKSDNIGLLNELFRLNLITRAQLKLVAIYQFYHHTLHQRVLQNNDENIDSNLIENETAEVINCWNECFGLEK